MSVLFSPIALGPLPLRNRIVIAPMCQYSAEAGNATDWHMVHLGRLALSGAGLLIIEATAVEDIGRITQADLGLYSDDNQAALARVLAPSPDILLLDEPTNHLDLPTIEWLEGELSSRKCALVIISHDRRFLSNLSRSTAWLDRGQIRQIDRGFSAFEAWRDEVLAEEERDQHKLDRKIVNEEHWLRYGVSGRRKRNVKRLGNLHALRDQRRTYRGATGNANHAAAEADKSGQLVIEAKNIAKAYGDSTIVDGFSIRVQRGDSIGIGGLQNPIRTERRRDLQRNVVHVHRGDRLRARPFEHGYDQGADGTATDDQRFLAANVACS